MSNLNLVVCGAPLAGRTPDLVAALEAVGWAVTPMVTAAGIAWASSTVGPAKVRRPEEAKATRPDAIVVCPMTFNTGNKWAAGVADTPVMSLLCEALGSGKPIVAVPFINESLWAHPAWPGSLSRLKAAAVRLVDPATGGSTLAPLSSGTGNDIAEAFDTDWIVAALRG